MQENNINSKKLVMLFPLLLYFMPRPPIEGIQVFTYSLLGFLLILICLIYINKITFNKAIFNIAVFLYFYALIVCTSLIFGYETLSIDGIYHLFKPILFMIILVFGYIVGKINNLETIKSGLLKSAYVIISIQFVIGLCQLFNFRIFSFIYSYEKVKSIGEMVRITGTFANPNTFAWFILQLLIVIYLLEKRNIRKITWIFLGLLLLLLSGSRSFFLLLPLVIIVIHFLSTKKNIYFWIFKIPMYVLFIILSVIGIYRFLERFGEIFPYLGQLIKFFESGNLREINSFDTRISMWKNGIDKLDSGINWIFGLGPASVKVIDNDYLYALTNYGVLGLFIILLMIIIIFVYFSRISSDFLRVIGQQYIILTLIIGLQFETFSGWNYPLLLMFYTGLAIGWKNKENIYIDNKEVKKAYFPYLNRNI